MRSFSEWKVEMRCLIHSTWCRLYIVELEPSENPCFNQPCQLNASFQHENRSANLKADSLTMDGLHCHSILLTHEDTFVNVDRQFCCVDLLSVSIVFSSSFLGGSSDFRERGSFVFVFQILLYCIAFLTVIKFQFK